MELKSLVKKKSYDLSCELKGKTCINCGTEKVCLNFSDWGYKFGNKFCCSYHCMREMQRKYDEMQLKKVNRVLDD